MTDRKSTYEVVTSRMLELLDQGVVPWRKPWEGGPGGCPKNIVTGKPYRGSNVFMLAFAGYDSPFWCTYKQAKLKGGNVRKGEKGSPVVFWKWLDINETDSNTGKKSSRRIPMLRQYTVFNLEQCDGIESPGGGTAVPDHDFDPIEEAEGIVDKMPNRPEITHAETKAYFSLRQDVVNVPKPEKFGCPAEYYNTLFHELGHSTGHESRLGRLKADKASTFGSGSYSREELVAEMSAAFLCGECGIVQDTIENSAAYIASWSKQLQDDPKLVVMAAAQAQKASDYILDRQAA